MTAVCAASGCNARPAARGLCTRHLGIDTVYNEVKERIHDMNDYLDADALRRQANTVVRLTVVTILGMVGTTTTGLLGMTILANPAVETPLLPRAILFTAVLATAVALTMYTIAKSKRLSDFLDAMSDERISSRNKLRALTDVWRNGD